MLSLFSSHRRATKYQERIPGKTNIWLVSPAVFDFWLQDNIRRKKKAADSECGPHLGREAGQMLYLSGITFWSLDRKIISHEKYSNTMNMMNIAYAEFTSTYQLHCEFLSIDRRKILFMIYNKHKKLIRLRRNIWYRVELLQQHSEEDGKVQKIFLL